LFLLGLEISNFSLGLLKSSVASFEIGFKLVHSKTSGSQRSCKAQRELSTHSKYIIKHHDKKKGKNAIDLEVCQLSCGTR
jgi:hypothetical protein